MDGLKQLGLVLSEKCRVQAYICNQAHHRGTTQKDPSLSHRHISVCVCVYC